MAINAALNRGVAHSKLDVNPLAGKMKKLNEDNIRERVLTGEEFERLLGNLKSPLREMALVAFYICMRQGEILKLTWDKVDLERNFIRLPGTDTKNGSKRRIPIHPRVREMLLNLPRGLHTNRVFLSKGKSVNNFAGNLLICRVLKRNYCSGSYVFNRCSVSYFTIQYSCEDAL